MLANSLIELLHQNASDAVDRSAGRKWDHDGDSSRRIALGDSRGAQGTKKSHKQRHEQYCGAREHKRQDRREAHGVGPLIPARSEAEQREISAERIRLAEAD
jgi:hypothetical protein